MPGTKSLLKGKARASAALVLLENVGFGVFVQIYDGVEHQTFEQDHHATNVKTENRIFVEGRGRQGVIHHWPRELAQGFEEVEQFLDSVLVERVQLFHQLAGKALQGELF